MHKHYPTPSPLFSAQKVAMSIGSLHAVAYLTVKPASKILFLGFTTTPGFVGTYVIRPGHQPSTPIVVKAGCVAVPHANLLRAGVTAGAGLAGVVWRSKRSLHCCCICSVSRCGGRSCQAQLATIEGAGAAAKGPQGVSVQQQSAAAFRAREELEDCAHCQAPGLACQRHHLGRNLHSTHTARHFVNACYYRPSARRVTLRRLLLRL
jgi:hypothetical protein